MSTTQYVFVVLLVGLMAGWVLWKWLSRLKSSQARKCTHCGRWCEPLSEDEEQGFTMYFQCPKCGTNFQAHE